MLKHFNDSARPYYHIYSTNLLFIYHKFKKQLTSTFVIENTMKKEKRRQSIQNRNRNDCTHESSKLFQLFSSKENFIREVAY